MFKSSMQRHVRVGNLARRQLSTFVARQIRSRPLIASYQRWPHVELHLAPLSQVTSRLYSQESAAAHSHAETEDSPASLYEITRFEDLRKLGVNERIVRSITEDMGYEKMTDVQSLTINPALKGVDLVAQAKTGTGKTLGFLIPVLQRILEADPALADRAAIRRASSEDIRAIILSPTRELAEQIGVEARKVTRHTGIVVQTAVGGTRKREALAKMQHEGCDILVATPGRLHDILSDSYAHVAAPRLQAFVLDEADRMLDVGFADAIRDILDVLPPIEEVDRQTLLFSATIPRDVVRLAKNMVKTDNFEFVQTISPDDAPTHEKVPQHLVTVPSYENWFPAIMEIAYQAIRRAQEDPTALPFKAIVFFSSTATVQFANLVFRRTQLGRPRSGVHVLDIHSKLSQHQRTRHADTFRRAQSGILLSSDVTARGMDFPNVSHVIQVGLPPDRDQYIHRIGRTGRAGNAGEGWLILAKDEIQEARRRLPGLPIKPNRGLKTAEHVVGQGPPPQEVAHLFEDISRAYGNTTPEDFDQVYNALLGQKFGRELQADDVVTLLNNWALNGLGRSEPPLVSEKMVRNRGLSRVSGLNIGDRPRGRSDSSFGAFGGSRDFGGSRGSRDSRDSMGFGGFGGSRDSRDSQRGGSSGRRFGSRDEPRNSASRSSF
ncbi:DEAD-domain-containing protein [Hypoxylon crocopeplum]|nr:DEAD-domain-containing protein [Hypoxylon crocopeplum]